MNTVAILPQLVMRLLQSQNVKRNNVAILNTAVMEPVVVNVEPIVVNVEPILAANELLSSNALPSNALQSNALSSSDLLSSALPHSALETTVL